MFGAHPEVVNDESGPPESKGPRYFAKHGPVGANPHKTKKDGGGRANWGRDGDEVEDYGYNMAHPRRRSNSNGQAPHELKTKFETRDQEPVFDESIHGPPTLEEADEEEDSGSTPVGGAGARAGASVTDAVGADEEKESAASTSGGSIEEEDRAKKV